MPRPTRLLAATYLSVFSWVTAGAQASTYPAPENPVPRIKEKKLASYPSDGWRVEGLAFRYSTYGSGVAADSAGQEFFLARYPDSDRATSGVAIDWRKGFALANGPASFRTPDGLGYAYGAYADGRPSGPWVGVSFDTVVNVATACPDLLGSVPPTEILRRLEDCFPERAIQRLINVITASYRSGQLDGAYRRKVLSGELREVSQYGDGGLIGETRLFNEDDSLETHLAHTASGTDTIYQRPPGHPADDTLFAPGERMPAFPCSGEEPDFATATELEKEQYYKCSSNAMEEYIYGAIQYPESARTIGYEGTPVVTFTVERDGSLANVHVVRFVCASIDAEALRVISEMPAWRPGVQRGKPVRVQFNLPITFSLE